MTIRLDHRRNISVHLEISRSSVRSSEIPPLVTGDPATDRYCQDLRLSRLVYNLSSLKRTTLCRARIYVHCQASGLAPTGYPASSFFVMYMVGSERGQEGKASTRPRSVGETQPISRQHSARDTGTCRFLAFEFCGQPCQPASRPRLPSATPAYHPTTWAGLSCWLARSGRCCRPGTGSALLPLGVQMR